MHHHLKSAQLFKATETEDKLSLNKCHSCQRHFYEAIGAALTCCRFNYAPWYQLILWAVTTDWKCCSDSAACCWDDVRPLVSIQIGRQVSVYMSSMLLGNTCLVIVCRMTKVSKGLVGLWDSIKRTMWEISINWIWIFSIILFERFARFKLLSEAHSDPFTEIYGVNRTRKPTGQHLWEMSGVPVHVLSSFSKFRSQFCSFPQERPAERGISASFWKSCLCSFQFGRKPATLQRSTKVGQHPAVGVTVWAARSRPFPRLR